jgi:hypothetical protein
MAEEQVVMSKTDLQELLKALQAGQAEMLTAAVKAAREPNPIEAKAIREQIEADKRRTKLMVELGKVEEEAERRRKTACSHKRYPHNSGRYAGHPAPRTEGEFCTSGQLVGDLEDQAVLICQRCSYTWRWMITPQERQYIRDVGLLGFPPPAPERLIQGAA